MNPDIIADMETKDLITIYHYIVHWTGRILYGSGTKRMVLNSDNGHLLFFDVKG